MTKREYVEMLAKLYYQANLSDSDRAEGWQHKTDSAVHCQAFDQIVRHMGLSSIWANILEGDLLDEI